MKLENIEDIYELSPLQQGLLFQALYGLDREAYVIQLSFAMRGDFNADAFKRAWHHLLGLHTALRTSFYWEEVDKPLQVVNRQVDLPVTELDWRHIPPARQDELLSDYAAEDRQRGFDCSQAPLMRLSLIRLADDAFHFIWCRHHLLIDGWSMSLVLNQVFSLYQSFCDGEPLTIGAGRPYGEFIEWLQKQSMSEMEAFWRSELKGFTSPTPSLDERAAGSSLKRKQGGESYERQYLHFSETETHSIKSFARQHRLTTNTLLQASWGLLLSRYTGMDDVVFGTTMSGRSANLQGIEDMVGLLINTVPIRMRMADDCAVLSWLEGLQKRQLAVRQHEYSPLVQVQSWSEVSRGTPLFETLFVLENYPLDSSLKDRIPNLAITNISHVARADYPLALVATLEPHLSLRATYDCSRYDAERIAQVLGHYKNLLQAMMANAQATFDSLPMMTEIERRQIIEDWNNTGAFYPRQHCIHEMLQAQAEINPHSVAVEFGQESLTYYELNRRANQLARHLRSIGVGPEVLVGICVERSVEMVIEILATLKAGGAYIPLDPSYPKERLSYVLDDARPLVLLAHEAVEARLPSHATKVIYLDGLWERLAQEDAENLPNTASPDTLAYVIYTSGSTGKPKGVLITHYNVAQLFQSSYSKFNFDSRDVWTQFHSYSFDFSVWEIFGALLYGGRLVIVDYWVSRSPEAFYRLLTDSRVTVLSQTPSAFMQLMRVDGAEAAGLELRVVIFGGEALDPRSLKNWYERHGDARPELINMYGITETCVHVTYRKVMAEDIKTDAGSVIGWGLDNLQVYLLDDRMRPVPIGVAGEMYVGGGGLARGYLNAPDQTAQRFVPDPFSGKAGERLYKTGDLGRLQGRREIQYLGRKDKQVKLRGFRIELGEIEAALGQHQRVKEAVAVAQNDESGDGYLAAYVVPVEKGALTAGELRSFLSSKLPDYMVPSTFVMMDTLPLTSNGKRDYAALPSAERTRQGFDMPFVAPRNSLEQFVADIWCEVLSLDGIGVNDDFFELGGNSLKAAVVINKFQEKLGEIIYVVAIFDAPNVADFALYLGKHHAEAVKRICELEPTGGSQSLADLPASERAEKISALQIAQMRRLIEPLSNAPAGKTRAPRKNVPAVFVLSPPRSGSTLLRVMLGGHSSLFAPPELELLSFNTLADRSAAFSGRDSFWLEGLVRAVMQIKRCDASQAKRIIDEYEKQGLTCREFYGVMQGWIGDRVLVDKTPSYSMDMEILKRAEEDFDGPLYLHLVRHPYGMIRSFEEAKLDQIFSRYKHPFSTKEFAELVWVISHQNILEFLKDIPAERQHRVKFEDLVSEPQPTVESLSRFLGVNVEPEMLEPYREKQRRMTDGIYQASKMLGDIKFHEHKGIDADVADRWKQNHTADFLGDVTLELAESFGYEASTTAVQPGPVTLTSIAPIPRDRSVELPLSFAQQRLWFLSQLEPDNPFYNCPGAVRITARMDFGALEQVLGEAVRRHEVLRTRIETVKGRAVQIIDLPSRVPLFIVDLRELPEAEREARALELAALEARRPFDIAKGPLLRARVLRLSEDVQVMLLTMHHIISDGWSTGLLIQELLTLYDAFTSGEKSPLPELSVQYADFANWQQQWLQGEMLEAELSYWKRQLADLPVLNIPTDYPRPAAPTYRGGHQFLTLPPRLSEALRVMGHNEDVTLFMVLAAAFKVLLYNMTNQDDIVVGTNIANRNHFDTDRMVGFFVNQLVLRTDLSGDPSFRELLARVRKVALEAYARQQLPFDKLVEALKPERSLSSMPLFQVKIDLNDAPQLSAQKAGLTLSPIEVDTGTTHLDLILLMKNTEPEITGSLLYSLDLFDAATIKRMLMKFEALLSNVVETPDARLSALSDFLAETEKQHLLRSGQELKASRRSKLKKIKQGLASSTQAKV